jgi:hypothetical protein
MWALVLASCIVGGSVSDAEPEGAFMCQAPLAKDEAVVLKGENCLAEFLMGSSSSPLLLSDSDVRSVSFPWVDEIDKVKDGNTFTHQDTNLSVLEFFRQDDTRDAIKEYNIRYVVYSTTGTYIEPRPEPWSWEDWKGAIYSSQEKSSYISVLVLDAQDPQVVGSLYQRSEGHNRMVPLLLVFSLPDTERSACQEMAEAVSDLFLGDCAAFKP